MYLSAAFHVKLIALECKQWGDVYLRYWFCRSWEISGAFVPLHRLAVENVMPRKFGCIIGDWRLHPAFQINEWWIWWMETAVVTFFSPDYNYFLLRICFFISKQAFQRVICFQVALWQHSSLFGAFSIIQSSVKLSDLGCQNVRLCFSSFLHLFPLLILAWILSVESYSEDFGDYPNLLFQFLEKAAASLIISSVSIKAFLFCTHRRSYNFFSLPV